MSNPSTQPPVQHSRQKHLRLDVIVPAKPTPSGALFPGRHHDGYRMHGRGYGDGRRGGVEIDIVRL